MTTWFTCPDCHRLHSEPLDASYHVAVRCPDCEFDAGVNAASLERTLPLAA